MPLLFHAPAARLASALVACLVAAGCARGRREPAPEQQPVATVEEGIARLRGLEGAASALPQHRRDSFEWCNLQVYFRKARHLIDRYEPNGPMLETLARELFEAQRSLDALKIGRPARAPGERWEGYYSDNDGSYQPFIRILPDSWNPRASRKMPVIVFLHCYSPALDIVNWGYIPASLVQFAKKAGFCIVAPFARSNTDFQGIGEQDVLNALAETALRYPVDEDRVVLCGISMGGMGAWTIAAHYPDLWAGVAAVAARGDYYVWHNVKREDLPDYKRRLIDMEFGFSMLPNLGRLPIYAAHGALDQLVPVREGRHMAEALKRINPDAIYVELPHGDHWIYDEVFSRPDFQEWLVRRRRSAPAEFDYVTYHPRYSRAWWLELEEITNFPASVSVRLRDGAVRIAAEGARSALVRTNAMPPALRGLRLEPAGLALAISDARKAVPPPPRGPVKEAFLEPFILVQAEAEPASSGSEAFARAVDDWRRFAKASPRVAAEREFPIQERGRYNLFIYGEPETSPMLREALANTPIRIGPDCYAVAGKSYPRTGAGLYVVCRNPWNPMKLAVVHCGIPWGERLPENHKYDFLPDYIVYIREADADGSNKALCAGFFDAEWRISAP